MFEIKLVPSPFTTVLNVVACPALVICFPVDILPPTPPPPPLGWALFYILQSNRYSSTNSRCVLVVQPSFCAML